MTHHRFRDLVQSELTAANSWQLNPGVGFMACPVALQAVGMCLAWQQQVYQWAFEQARAVVRPSRLERWQAATLN